MIHRTNGKPRSFINRTEGTAVPWTVASHTDQQAVSLAGGPYGSLFKSPVYFIRFARPAHILKSILNSQVVVDPLRFTIQLFNVIHKNQEIKTYPEYRIWVLKTEKTLGILHFQLTKVIAFDLSGATACFSWKLTDFLKGFQRSHITPLTSCGHLE
jgi:hypothetical protein